MLEAVLAECYYLNGQYIFFASFLIFNGFVIHAAEDYGKSLNFQHWFLNRDEEGLRGGSGSSGCEYSGSQL
jgi:hypothetical protein